MSANIVLPFSDNEIRLACENLIKTEIKPYILSHGGDIELVKVSNEKIFVKLDGACKGCSSSNITIKKLVEDKFKTFIHPELVVMQIN